MESTAQYWRSVWLELEPHMRLHLAQAFSNRAPRGRKRDFKDAERLVRRLIADELILSFVPNGEQRIWRSLTRMKVQLTRDRVRLQNQIECLLEEMRIKLSIVVSNLLGASGLRILHALAKGETDPKKLAQLGDERLQCTEEQLVDALTGRVQPMHREMLALQLERLQLIDQQMAQLHRMIAQAMKSHQDAVIRLAEVPGLGVGNRDLSTATRNMTLQLAAGRFTGSRTVVLALQFFNLTHLRSGSSMAIQAIHYEHRNSCCSWRRSRRESVEHRIARGDFQPEEHCSDSCG